MPVDWKEYPEEWEAISLSIKQRAGWRCEHCGADQGLPHPETGAEVFLAAAHLDHDPQHNDPSNLAALCQRCHNQHDAQHRLATRMESARQSQIEAGQQTFDFYEELG